jgi:hypothetical protein
VHRQHDGWPALDNFRLYETFEITEDDRTRLGKLGKVRPITVRLPVSTVAKIDELQKQCPAVWNSRQELLFEMIESCVQDWTDAQPQFKDTIEAVAKKALRRSADG